MGSGPVDITMPFHSAHLSFELIMSLQGCCPCSVLQTSWLVVAAVGLLAIIIRDGGRVVARSAPNPVNYKSQNAPFSGDFPSPNRKLVLLGDANSRLGPQRCRSLRLGLRLDAAEAHAMCEGPSKISGPIPPDPTLFPDYYKRPGTARGLEESARKFSLEPPWQGAPLDQPTPPIRPASQQGLLGILLQFQEVSLGKEPLPKKKDLKDHEKENIRRIQEIQKRCQEQEKGPDHGRSKPLKALWRSPKYDKVESRLKVKLQEPSATSGPELPAFLRAYSRCGPGVQPRRVASAGQALPRNDGSQPPGTDAKGQTPAVDFITHNARTAKVAPQRRSRSVQHLAKVQEQQQRAQEEYNARQKGQVPLYLVERKNLWRREAEERQRNQPDPEIPPGHTMMPESQRLDTLNSLLQSQQELLQELVLLPSRADSLRAQNHKAELEKKLSQVEEALKIFSRSKVFIKMDS